ncbi:MAG: DUF3857 domain-containing protein [Bacteroidales bacterium]
MKKIFIHVLIGWLLSFSAESSGKYSVDRIHPSFLENASMVIRQDSTVWEIRGREKARMTRYVAKTIMEPEALGGADISIYYDSFRKVKSIKGSLYDAQGKKIRDMKSDEFEDTHMAGGVSVYADARNIQTDLYMNRYPFTVVFEYIIDESVVYPNRTWIPVSRTKTSLERASLTYIVPEEFSFRYKSVNHPALDAEITPSGRRDKQYRWELKNMEAFAHEPYMPPDSYIFPYVQTGANEFVYGGYSGSMESWDDFGKWINDLNRDKQNLGDDVIADIMSLTENTPDTLEKVRKIYEYMQSRTRYVSIQLGIGGFQPDDANNVASNAYGDCKALSNFTQALLAVAGIKSHYTLIYNGKRYLEVDPGFPYNSFNHAIICVPLQNDTVWLETTNNIGPMGFIGESNSDRWLLLVTENGGKLARTPAVVPQQNLAQQSIVLNADNDFSIRGEVHQKLTGLAMDGLMGISKISETRQRNYYNRLITLNQFQLESLNFYEEKSPPGYISKTAEFNLQGYFRKAGDRYIFQPVLITESASLPSLRGEKKYNFQLVSYITHSDTIFWKLPEGYQLSQIPENFSIDSPYGFYNINYHYQPTSEELVIYRKFYGKRGLFPPHQWNDFVDFLRTVQQNDRTQLMLVPGS